MTAGPSLPGKRIDWDAVRARLRRAELATQEALDPTPERARAIMDARARALARPAVDEERRGAILDVVLFSLGREEYGIEARFVREVARLTHLTPVPGTPDFILGVTNLRGTVLPLMDLRRFFGAVPTGLTDMARVLVVGGGEASFGIMVDDSHRQVDLAANRLLPPGPEWPEDSRALIRGITEDALILVDGAALIADNRLYVKK